MNASTAWSTLATYVEEQGGSSSFSKIKVAVIDTGAYLSHEDLSGVIDTDLSVEVYGSSSSGWSYKTLRGDGYVNGTSTNDGSTHGTHVSGIIAAQSNNGVGIQGTGSGGTTSLANSIIDLVVVDAFEQSDGASVASIVYAMDYAYTVGCTIMNLSVGTTSTSSVLKKECDTLYAAGVTIVCAAGNEGSTEAVYPADYSSTISVINITSSGTKADSSSYGDEDISAPGTSIYSTKNGGSYVTMSGTSMAAPVVTAAAAMLTYVDASLTPSKIKSILCSTATDLYADTYEGYDVYSGYGAVNIAAAVAAVLGEDTTYDIAYATVSGISSSYTATGSAITPTPTVKCYGVVLTEDSDYTLSYSNNTAPGTATITITGIGNYTGTKQVTFTIVKASQTLSVSASSTSIYTYATSTITASGTGTITYSSGNTSIATVSSSGVVTGKASGTVTITVTAAGNTYYNSATKTVSITVKTGTTVYNGVDYSTVYDYGYYINKYSDLKTAYGSNETAALVHFITYGMSEGRQANENFNVYSYAYKYSDLRNAFKNNLPSYYTHYMTYGKKEGHAATGTTTMQNCVTTYNGVDYSSVYNGTYYISKYSDIKNAFGLDDEAVLQHFITYGMKEGRQASENFNVYSYAYKYSDLRNAFKNNLPSYYTHYMTYGKKEGHAATGTTTMQNCVTTYNGVDYSSVYNGTYYISKYSDIKNAFGLDDEAVLQHFITYGMKEGRQASASFNVSVYRSRYSDLRAAFGSDLKSYYIHYIDYGKAEGRTAV
ncbi:MAG: S8 family serine peptidase [Clostridiales bacterium]|nr:S8 family serine peptidase [Clostridiales bacterium]